MNRNQQPSLVEAPVNAQADAEAHHGDLRKGAYLKRRAAYQLQAGGNAAMQAGGMPGAATTAPGTGRNG